MGKIRTKAFVFIFLAFILIFSVFIALNSIAKAPMKPSAVDVFVGIDAAFGNVQDVKTIIDEVKSYTNFFVVGSNNVTNNEANINEVCKYLSDSGLYFATYAHPEPSISPWQGNWTRNAIQKWSTHYVGLYAYDEPGGHQIDHDDFFMQALNADNYTDASNMFVKNMSKYLNDIRVGWQTDDFPLITSDYALHEFDYRAGYDAILAEFAWDNIRPLNIALVRGAANVHGKNWGIMITRSLNDSQGAESGQKMYDDMVLAYQNGAKYIVLFDYPNFAQGILNQEHFNALKQFWQYIQNHPRTNGIPADEKVAYVLPKDYGFGFRNANDKIWGLWEADNQSAKIFGDLNSWIQQYPQKLDVIYEDNLPGSRYAYGKILFWNGTRTGDSITDMLK